MRILCFHITREIYFYIKIENKKLYGSGPNTDYQFIPLKDFTTDKKERKLYELMEEKIEQLSDEKEIAKYVEKECNKKDLYVSKQIGKKEYEQKYGI